jgi:hypothetical protein
MKFADVTPAMWNTAYKQAHCEGLGHGALHDGIPVIEKFWKRRNQLKEIGMPYEDADLRRFLAEYKAWREIEFQWDTPKEE